MAEIKNIKDKTSLESFAQDESLFKAGTAPGRRSRIPRTQGPRGRSVSGYTGDLSVVSEFKFLECEAISINGAVPEECPVCTPNPYAYVPDYTLMTPGETYFDGKTCTFCYMMEVAPPNRGGPSVMELSNETEEQEDIKRIGIRNMLEYHNKAPIATVFYYEEEEASLSKTSGDVVTAELSGVATGAAIGAAAGGWIGAVIGATVGWIASDISAQALIPSAVAGFVLRSEERDVIEELLDYTDIRYTVPIQLKGRTKIAVCIDAEAWSRIPTKLEIEPSTPFDANYEVSFTGEDFMNFGGMFDRVAGDSPLGLHMYAGAMNLFQKQLVDWRDFDGGKLRTIEKGELILLNLEDEANSLLQLRDAVASIIDESTGFVMSRIGRNDVERITFKFEPIEDGTRDKPKLVLRELVFNKKGCPDITFSQEEETGKGFFRKLIRQAPFGQSRSLYYLGCMPYMDVDLTASDPMPWLEFVLKYTYPAIEISYDKDSTDMFNNPDLYGCLAEQLSEGAVGAAMEELQKQLISLPDAFLGIFGENLCLSEEDLANKKYGLARYAQGFGAKEAWNESVQEITKGDPYLDAVFAYLAQIMPGGLDSDGAWDLLLSRMGYCGWISLMQRALDCIVQGMGEQDFKKAMVETWMASVGDKVLQTVMGGLPQDAKDRISAMAGEEFKDLPLPWDVQAYKIGSYGTPEMLPNEKYAAVMAGETGFADDSEEDEWTDTAEEEAEQKAKTASTIEDLNKIYTRKAEEIGKEMYAAGYSVDDLYEPSKLEEIYNKLGELIVDGFGTSAAFLLRGDYEREEVSSTFDDTPEAQAAADYYRNKLETLQDELDDATYDLEHPLNPLSETTIDTSGGLWGLGYSNPGEEGEFDYGDISEGAGGTYGEALGAVQKEVFDAYRDVLLEAVGIDYLFDEMGKIPGAPIVGSFIQTLPCKAPPMFAWDPRWDSFLNTMEWDFCQIASDNMFDITIPQRTSGTGLLRMLAGAWNAIKLMFVAVREAIDRAVIAIVLAAIKALIQWLLSLACNLLRSFGASLMDLHAGSQHFRDMLAENMCPGADDDILADALRGIMNGFGDSDCITQITNEEMGSFIDDVSVLLTQEHVVQLLQGQPNQETLALALEVARLSPSPCIREMFSDPAALKNFFSSLGIFVPGGSFDRYLPDMPTSPCPPDLLARVNELRCNLLAEKGLSDSECRDELDKLKENAILDLKDLVNLMQNGPMADFPALNSSGDCPSDGFYPAGPDPIAEQVGNSYTSMLLTPIEKGVMKDLMGSQGVINNILADTEGRRWSAHSWKVRLFGSPKASQLWKWEWNSDDGILSPDGDDIVDIYGNKLSYLEANGGSWMLPLLDKIPGLNVAGSSGGYPPTVGAWMAHRLRGLNPEFKTQMKPAGYSSLRSAMLDKVNAEEENERRIEARLNYVEAFIREYGLDSLDATGDTAELAGMLKKACYSRRLFEKGREGHTKGEYENGEVGESVYWLERLLTGKSMDCCGKEFLGFGHSAIYSSNQVNPYSWSDSNQEHAGTNGKLFTNYYEKNKWTLRNVPNVMSSDLALHYGGHDYNEDTPVYAYQVLHDYNLADETGAIGRDNNYRIRIQVVMNDLPEEDEYASGGTDHQLAPIKPIIQHNSYTYYDYDFVVEANLDEDVKSYINELPVSESVSDSWQIEVFYRLLSQAMISEADDDSDAGKLANLLENAKFRNYFDNPKNGIRKLDDISSGFFRRLCNRISTGRSFGSPNVEMTSDVDFLAPDVSSTDDPSTGNLALDNLAPAFRYGQLPDDLPEIVYLDNETYGGPLGRLFPDLVPPPFYVKPPNYSGWKEMAEALVPSLDGCEPSRGPLFALGDLAQKASELKSKLSQDERFSYDPLCSTEAPYDKILDNSTAANIDAVLRAITRVYITEAYLRAVPIISQFEMNDDNIESGIVEYIVERMKRGLFPDGITTWLWFNDETNDNDYYYRFMEQTFNTIARKVDSGILDPEIDFNSEEKDAYELIKSKVVEFYDRYDGQLASLSDTAIKNQSFLKEAFSNTATRKFGGVGAGSADFDKKAAKKSKEAAFELMIDETIDSALVFVKRMVREEMPIVGNSFNSRLYPPIKNIDHLFLLSPAWIRGAINDDGPLDVMSDPTSARFYKIPSGMPNSVSEVIGELQMDGLLDLADQFNTAFGGFDEWPFVLEKYVRIIDQEDPPPEVSNRAGNLYDIVNMEDWKTYVQSKKSQGVSGPISNWFGRQLPAGETTLDDGHIHKYEVDADGNGFALKACDDEEENTGCHIHRIVNWKVMERDNHSHDIPKPAWKFGLRICYMPEKDANDEFAEIIDALGSSVAMNKKAFKVQSSSGPRYMIPIASAELDIPDQDFTLFSPDAYDVYCLIPPLVESPAYKAWFRYVFPLPRFLSLLTIYCMQGFYDSLGNEGWPSEGGDMWENRGGNVMSSFKNWDRSPDKAFEKSREAGFAALTSLYETMQAEYDSKNASKGSVISFAQLLKPKLNFEDGLRWWQRGRRIKNSPYDMYGDKCKK
jgi:hypothetical protein